MARSQRVPRRGASSCPWNLPLTTTTPPRSCGRSRFAPLPFLIDLEVLPAHLNLPDLGHGIPVQLDRELERAADERLGDAFAAHVLDDLGEFVLLRLVAAAGDADRLAILDNCPD